MKKIFTKISKAFILFGILTIITGCSTSTNTSDGNKKNNDTSTIKETDTDSGNDTTSDDNDDSSNTCSIVIPKTFTVEYNGHFSSYIDDITFTNCKTDDKIELVIEYNNGADLAEANYYDPIRKCIFLYSYSTGIIGISLENKTAKVKSNTCIVTFTDNTNNSGGNDEGNTISSLCGTWSTTYQSALIDTIEFYNDGTGKCYKSGYSGSNTFNWNITEPGKMIVTNSLNQQGECTYTLNGNILVLKNFMGLPTGTEITFVKN